MTHESSGERAPAPPDAWAIEFMGDLMPERLYVREDEALQAKANRDEDYRDGDVRKVIPLYRRLPSAPAPSPAARKFSQPNDAYALEQAATMLEVSAEPYSTVFQRDMKRIAAMLRALGSIPDPAAPAPSQPPAKIVCQRGSVGRVACGEVEVEFGHFGWARGGNDEFNARCPKCKHVWNERTAAPAPSQPTNAMVEAAQAAYFDAIEDDANPDESGLSLNRTAHILRAALSAAPARESAPTVCDCGHSGAHHICMGEGGDMCPCCAFRTEEQCAASPALTGKPTRESGT